MDEIWLIVRSATEHYYAVETPHTEKYFHSAKRAREAVGNPDAPIQQISEEDWLDRHPITTV